MKKSVLHKNWHTFASPPTKKSLQKQTRDTSSNLPPKLYKKVPEVVSTKPTPPGKFVPLSILDRVMENNHILVVFYYQFPLGKPPGELTEKLRESMAEMLSSYPIATGRLLRNSEGNWMVKFNDAGLRIVEAKAKGSVHEWLQNVDREKEMKLVHWEEMSHKSYFWATFYVQITEFECGGVSIGLSCTHLLSDPKSAAALIKSWADFTPEKSNLRHYSTPYPPPPPPTTHTLNSSTTTNPPPQQIHIHNKTQ